MKIVNELLEFNFLDIPIETKYWFVRASTKARFYDDFRNNNFIAIGHNSVELSTLSNIDNKMKEESKLLKTAYQTIFHDTYIAEIKNNNDYKELSDTEKSKKIESVKRSATIAANKTLAFVEEMEIGDYIILPFRGSDFFLIGMVVSDVFDEEIDHQDMGPNNTYEFSTYDKKRRVIWVKEITINEFPDKLMWVQRAHKSIFDITKNAEEINPIIANEYIYNGRVHMKINVNTKDPISTSTWYQYQKLLNRTIGQKENEVYQKTNVQSPGNIILETLVSNWQYLALAGGALFFDVDVDIKGVKFKTHGALSFLLPGDKERKATQSIKDSIEIEKDKELLKSMKLDNKLKELEVREKGHLLAQLTSEKKNLVVESEEIVQLNEKKIKLPEDDELEAIQQMELSQKTSGTDILYQRQIDNLI